MRWETTRHTRHWSHYNLAPATFNSQTESDPLEPAKRHWLRMSPNPYLILWQTHPWLIFSYFHRGIRSSKGYVSRYVRMSLKWLKEWEELRNKDCIPRSFLLIHRDNFKSTLPLPPPQNPLLPPHPPTLLVYRYSLMCCIHLQYTFLRFICILPSQNDANICFCDLQSCVIFRLQRILLSAKRYRWPSLHPDPTETTASPLRLEPIRTERLNTSLVMLQVEQA